MTKKYRLIFVSLIAVLVIVITIIFFLKRNSHYATISQLENVASNEPVYESVSQFYSSPKDQRIQKNIYWANFDRNQDKKKILLNDILPEAASSQERNIFVRYMSQNVFDVFQCQEKNEDMNYGVYFTFEHLKNYPGDSYADARKALDVWGPHILTDMNRILFPNDVVSEKDLGQELRFSPDYFVSKDLGINYKNAEVSIGSVKKEIYYGVVDGYVILATSKNCLFTASNELFTLVP